MALNASTTASAIVSALGLTGAEATAATAKWTTILSALFTRIAADAVVTASVAVVSVSGVTPGGGVSGPGAGTATGTIS